jgi:hypothetical protein
MKDIVIYDNFPKDIMKDYLEVSLLKDWKS